MYNINENYGIGSFSALLPPKLGMNKENGSRELGLRYRCAADVSPCGLGTYHLMILEHLHLEYPLGCYARSGVIPGCFDRKEYCP